MTATRLAVCLLVDCNIGFALAEERRSLSPSEVCVRTLDRVAKFDGGGNACDSSISEVGGKVGIGTVTPAAPLHIFGGAGQDVFARLGPNSASDPAFNFGYAGGSIGRSAGFFNVRPDPSAVPPNPSLRFFTGNVQRMIIANDGSVGIGLAPSAVPGQKLHIGDGNVLLEGGLETAIKIKRDVTYEGPSGTSANPIFELGRIIQAGDLDPEFRVMYVDDGSPERAVFEFDRKGIVASVKQERGSHFEGFVKGPIGTEPGDEHPAFRLNSYPKMRLEMGEGGETPVDVAVERSDANTLSIFTAGLERVRVDDKYIRIPAVTNAPPPDADCNEASEAGRLIVRTDGTVNLYVCRGADGWIGK